jgi:hypothetical protein
MSQITELALKKNIMIKSFVCLVDYITRMSIWDQV